MRSTRTRAFEFFVLFLAFYVCARACKQAARVDSAVASLCALMSVAAARSQRADLTSSSHVFKRSGIGDNEQQPRPKTANKKISVRLRAQTTIVDEFKGARRLLAAMRKLDVAERFLSCSARACVCVCVCVCGSACGSALTSASTGVFKAHNS